MSGSGVGLVLQSPTCELMEQAICLSLHARLDLTLMLVAAKLKVRSDSWLIVRQIQ